MSVTYPIDSQDGICRSAACGTAWYMSRTEGCRAEHDQEWTGAMDRPRKGIEQWTGIHRCTTCSWALQSVSQGITKASQSATRHHSGVSSCLPTCMIICTAIRTFVWSQFCSVPKTSVGTVRGMCLPCFVRVVSACLSCICKCSCESVSPAHPHRDCNRTQCLM